MSERVLPYWNDFQKQKSRPGLEDRKVQRYKTAYTYSKSIARFFKRKGILNKVLVVLPPASYFKNRGLTYPVPEPAVFYYFTGLKTVSARSGDAVKANWMIRAENGQLIMDSVTSKDMLIDSIRVFQKFPPSL